MNIVPCKQIEEKIGKLFTCSEMNGYVRIRTPYLYPDGDVIDLFLSEKNGSFTLTDLGETLGWLKTQTVAPKKSPKTTSTNRRCVPQSWRRAVSWNANRPFENSR